MEEFYVNVICFDKVEIIQLKTGRSRETEAHRKSLLTVL